MTDAKTDARIDWPTILVVGASSPRYLDLLQHDAYSIASVATASDAAARMASLMPHVVVLSPAVPMFEHRLVHETALAVGAIVLLVPDDAHPELVRGEV